MKSKQVEEAERYVEFLTQQRNDERAIITGVRERETALLGWIAEREASIVQMRAELDGLPARVILAQSRISGIEQRLSTARKHCEDVKRTTSLKRALMRAKDELTKLTRTPV